MSDSSPHIHGPDCGHEHHGHEHEHTHTHNHPVSPAGKDDQQGEEPLGGALRFLGFMMKGLLLILLLLVIKSGFFSVPPDKQMLAFSFKKMHGTEQAARTYTADSGDWYWTLPRPFGNTVTLPSSAAPLTTKVTTFWPSAAGNLTSNLANNREEDSKDPIVIGQDAYAVTGDMQIFHMRLNLTWRITDAPGFYRHFFQGNADFEKAKEQAENALSRSCESAVLATCAHWDVDQAFYRDLNGFRAELTKRLADRLTQLAYGITLDRIDLKPDDLLPPLQLRRSFREVQLASSEANSSLSKAREEEMRISANASAEADQILAEARAYKLSYASRIANRADKITRFNKVYDPQNPQDSLRSLYLQAIAEILAEVKDKYVIKPSGQGDEFRLMLKPKPKKRTATGGEVKP